MQNEKWYGFIRRRGTLGVLTLCLVGIVAFASYRTSYPAVPETETQTEEVKTAAGAAVNQKQVQKQVQKQTEGFQKANELDVDPASLVSSTEVTASGKPQEDGKAKVKETTAETEPSEISEKSQTEKQADEVLSGSVISPTVQFSEESSLTWPAAGSILMDYSMDGTVYFQTLNEYKYNPALIIRSEVGNPVVASAKGIIESIVQNEETGITLKMNIGNDYELIYGELKELAVTEGDVVEQGQLLGYVSEPTKYYCEEGSNLYFGMKKDGEIVDPCLYLE